ncbi:MAG: RIO kinase 1 [Myxococcota bacterium]
MESNIRVPERLVPLIDLGVVDEVVRPLMSGKEAEVFLVLKGDELRVAKIYKEASRRSFKHRAEYTEGRKVRNTRKARAMAKSSRYGREETEAAWRTAEVDAIYKLQAANVRVPEPFDYVEGVLVMELVRGEDGHPAPRLVDINLEPDEALAMFHVLLTEVVKMLCAGIVHGDLSDFNVLLSPDGPVIIDFPQAVDPAQNNNAQKLLIRDVQNLTSFFSRYTSKLKGTRYGDEMWSLYAGNKLTPETKLTGKFKGSSRKADTESLLEEIASIEREVRKRREALGLSMPAPAKDPEPLRLSNGRVIKPLKPGEPLPKRSKKQPPKQQAKSADPSKKRRRRRKEPATPAPSYDPLDDFLLIGD